MSISELEQRILIIDLWSKHHSKFDDKMFVSCKIWYQMYESLTARQQQGLYNVYRKFKIGEWFSKQNIPIERLGRLERINNNEEKECLV